LKTEHAITYIAAACTSSRTKRRAGASKASEIRDERERSIATWKSATTVDDTVAEVRRTGERSRIRKRTPCVAQVDPSQAAARTTHQGKTYHFAARARKKPART
jgi:hypothetical protein